MALLFNLFFFTMKADAAVRPEGESKVKVSASVVPDTLMGPGDVNVKISVDNSGGENDISEVKLYDDQGDRTTISSVIKKGEKASKEFSYSVSEDQLGGSIHFTVTWIEQDTPREAAVSVKVKKITPEPKVSFSRTVDKPTVSKGQKVKLTYTVKNTGNVDLTNVAVKEPELGTVKEIGKLAAGEEQKFSVSHTINGDFVTEPTLTCTGGGQQLSKRLEAITVTVANPSMKVELKADKEEVDAGDAVTLTCVLKNTGNMDFTNITIKDDNLGTVKKLDKLAVGATYVVTKQVTIDTTQSFVFHVTAEDAVGKTVKLDSNRLTIDVAEEEVEEEINMAIRVTSNVTQLKEPGKVEVDIVVSNNGTAAVKDMKIVEDTLGEIAGMDIMEPGDKLFKESIDVSQTTTFNFKVLVEDAQGRTREVAGTSLDITVGESTMDEAAGDSSLEEDTPETSEEAADQPAKSDRLPVLLTLLGVIIFLIVAAGVALVVLMIQERRSSGNSKHRKYRKYDI